MIYLHLLARNSRPTARRMSRQADGWRSAAEPDRRAGRLIRRANGQHQPPRGCGQEILLQHPLKAREDVEIAQDSALGQLTTRASASPRRRRNRSRKKTTYERASPAATSRVSGVVCMRLLGASLLL